MGLSSYHTIRSSTQMADREPIRAKITKQREESIAIVGDANLNRTILEITPIISQSNQKLRW